MNRQKVQLAVLDTELNKQKIVLHSVYEQASLVEQLMILDFD